MRTAALLLLLALAANTATNADDATPSGTDDTPNNTLIDTHLANDTNFNANDTITDDSDGEHEPVVRKKRTFGDIVFRGLADVLGYNVARKPPQVAFPPPLAPVPGIDTPLQAASTAAPASAAPAVAAPAPCGSGRAAAAPQPCRAQKPPAPKPKAAPPCPKPRAAAKPKPKPSPSPPPPPPPPPCAKARANPTTPSPCTPAPPPSPPKQDAESNLETITSNFRLNFNFNRKPVTPAPAEEQAAADTEDKNDAEAKEEPEAEQEEEEAAPIVPIAIQPKAAKLPPSEPRTPRVYVDAFVVRNGVAKKVAAVDATQFDPLRAADEDYLAYDEENDHAQYDDYEDVQESRDRERAVQEFGSAVDSFWEKKKQHRRVQPQRLPSNHYKSVHFGDRDIGQVRLQSLQQERPRANRIPLPVPAVPATAEPEEDGEATTTTEDPKKPLKPRVLPPTEHNPNEIDTVTVRVPPIYKAKRPKKHREQPVDGDRDSTEAEHSAEFDPRREEGESDTEGDDSWMTPYTERPIRRKRRRRKQNRSKRFAEESIEYSAGDYDYYGKKLPVSKEEVYYMQLTVPPPTKDADLARHEAPSDEPSMDDHERLKDDSERLKDDSERLREEPERSQDDDESEKISDDDSGRDDSHERADSRERSRKDSERTGDKGRADSLERTDKLSPNARVTETAYQNNFVHATNVQVDDPNPQVAIVEKETVTTSSP